MINNTVLWIGRILILLSIIVPVSFSYIIIRDTEVHNFTGADVVLISYSLLLIGVMLNSTFRKKKNGKDNQEQSAVS